MVAQASVFNRVAAGHDPAIVGARQHGMNRARLDGFAGHESAPGFRGMLAGDFGIDPVLFCRR